VCCSCQLDRLGNGKTIHVARIIEGKKPRSVLQTGCDMRGTHKGTAWIKWHRRIVDSIEKQLDHYLLRRYWL
jgi:hypothetical protein